MKICRIPYENTCRMGVRNLFYVTDLEYLQNVLEYNGAETFIQTAVAFLYNPQSADLKTEVFTISSSKTQHALFGVSKLSTLSFRKKK